MVLLVNSVQMPDEQLKSPFLTLTPKLSELALPHHICWTCVIVTSVKMGSCCNDVTTVHVAHSYRGQAQFSYHNKLLVSKLMWSVVKCKQFCHHEMGQPAHPALQVIFTCHFPRDDFVKNNCLTLR